MEKSYLRLTRRATWEARRNMNGELRLFLFADSENWGFSVLEAAREENKLYSRQPDFVPFEAGAWETDFFDGRH